MTVKKKKAIRKRKPLNVSLGICALAVVAMAGMYAIGRQETQTEILPEVETPLEIAEEIEEPVEVAETEKVVEIEEVLEKKELVTDGAELESDFLAVETGDVETQNKVEEIVVEQVSTTNVIAEIAPTFNIEEDQLVWPISGNILLDYSMDQTIFFPTLEQYKYNPAVIIAGEEGTAVMCGAAGIVSSIEVLDQTGTTMTVDLGNGYEAIYGQLKELTVAEGDTVAEGQTLGYVSSPTVYYTTEGSNVYFQVKKDGESIDPMSLLP